MSQVAAIKSAFLEALGISAITDADTNQQAQMLRAANAAIQEIAIHSPSNWNQIDEYGTRNRAPQTISIGVTAGSTAFTWAGLTTNQWAFENALVINGDGQVINRIKKGNSSNSLLFPYGGSTGTQQATLYNDIVELPPDFIRFKSDFTMLGTGPIQIVGSNREMVYYGDMTQGSPQFVGEPTAGRMISRMASDGSRRTFIKLDGLPVSEKRFFFEFYKGPTTIASFDDTRQDLVPFKYVESVLVPWCLWKLSQFLGGITMPADRINAGYSDARMTLDAIGDPTGATPPSEIQAENW